MGHPRREILRRRVHEGIVEYLLSDIKSGLYKIGEELPSERDLMDEFQVGRPAIRESLFRLERMGIIETRPGVRAKVRQPTVSPLLEEMGDVVALNLQTPEGQRYFQEARCFFESALARNAAKCIDEEHLKRMKELLNRKEALLDDVEAFADLDMEFHKVIAEIPGNPIFTAIYSNLSKWLLDQRLRTLSSPGQPETALLAHRRIYEALSAHDPDQAEKAMINHLRQIQELYQSLMVSAMGSGKG